MDNFWKNKKVLTLERIDKAKNPAQLLIKNQNIPCFKVSKETFLVKNKPLTSLFHRPDKDFWFIDTVMLGVLHHKNVPFNVLKQNIKKYIETIWSKTDNYDKV